MGVQKSSEFIEVVRNFPLAIFQVDSDLKILFFNEKGKEFTGYTDEDIAKGLNGFDLFVPEEHEAVTQNVNTVLDGNYNKCFEHTISRKDGTRFTINLYAIPLMSDEKVSEFWGVVLDVSDRKKMEEKTRQYSEHLEELVEERTKELRDSEKKFRFLAERMNDIIWIMDMSLHTTYVSPSIETVLGFTPEERKKQSVMEQLTPDSLELTFKLLSDEIAKEEQSSINPDRCINVEVEYYHKDGSTRWCENVISGIRNDKGTLIGLHGVSRDVTERKKTEEKLLESIRWNRTVFNGVIDAIFILDPELNCIDANTAAEQLTQYSDVELLEKNMIDLYDEKYRDRCAEIFSRITVGDKVSGDIEIKRKNGDLVPIEYRASMVTIQNQPYALVVANDLTLRKRYQDRLTALYEIALQMAKAENIESIADLCLSAINDVLRYDLCTFSLVEDNYIRFRYQNRENDVSELSLDTKGITVRAVKTGEIQSVPDVTKDPDYVKCMGYGVKSELAVPVKIHDLVRALINILL